MAEARSPLTGLRAPALFALIGAAAVSAAPPFLDAFASNVLTRSMLYAALAVTVDLLWGYTGILTFAQGAFFGVGAYATALTLTHLGATPALFLAALALAIVLPAALGALVGWISFYHGSTPLFASVISLVFPIVATQLVYSGGAWTGSSSGLVGYDVLPLEGEGFFRLAGLLLVAVLVAAWVFVRSDAGKLLIAVRDNEARCAYLGLDPKRIQIALTAILAAVAGLIGFVFANASSVVAPENVGFVFGTEIVIWVALGGRATLFGPAFAAIGIDYLSAQLSGDLPFLWQLVLGSLFVVTIIVAPEGAAGLARRLWRGGTAAPPRLQSLEPAPRDTKAGPLLAVRGLSRGFGALTVLREIDLSVRAGELLSLVGPNGAGKTTLMRCLSDGREPFRGEIAMGGQDIAGRPPNRVAALGVGRKFQVASIFEGLSVADCLRLARASHEAPSAWRASAALALPAPCVEVVKLTGLVDQLGAPARLLSHGLKQALELAMVLALEPQLVLLDEPTAGLTKGERTLIGEVLVKLTAGQGCAVVLVEHDFDFVREISSRIVVLHQGRLVMDGTVEDVANSALVREIYSGGGHG